MIESVYPPLEPGLLAAPRSGDFPFDQPNCLLTHLGRGAVWLAMRALGLPGKRIAMPAYHCGSEVEAARVAGVEIEFYRVRPDLSVDLDDLHDVAGRCDALYLISLFGFPTAFSDVQDLDIPVIQDAAHALFSLDPATASGGTSRRTSASKRRPAGAPIGSRATAAVFCPRKSLGVPDGGAVLLDSPLPAWEQAPARLMSRSLASLAVGRLAGSRMRAISEPASALMSKLSRTEQAAMTGEMTETVIGEWDLAEADFVAAAGKPSPITGRAVTRANGPAIRAKRREHYTVMAAALGDRVPERFRELPEGTCPLYLPVACSDRDETLRRLWSAGVRATEIWPVPHPLLDRHRFAELEPARRSLIALPVHQVVRDVDRLAQVSRRLLVDR